MFRKTHVASWSRAWPRLVVLMIATGCVLLGPTGGLSADDHQHQYVLGPEGWQAQTNGQPAPTPGSPDPGMGAIRQALANDDPEQAEDLADDWIEDHPKHTGLCEAYLLRADAKSARGHYYKALYDYEFVARSCPESELFQTALEREFRIAQLFAKGVKRKFLGLPIFSARAEAEEVFIRIQERVPGSALGEKASLALCEYYHQRKQWANASIACEMFLENYPNSPSRSDVLQRLIQASLATFRKPEYHSAGLLEAAQRLKQYKQEFPAAAEKFEADRLLGHIDESLAMKMFFTAQWYEKQGRPNSAAYVYGRVVRDYGHTAAAKQAIDRLQSLGQPFQGVGLEPPLTQPPAQTGGQLQPDPSAPTTSP